VPTSDVFVFIAVSLRRRVYRSMGGELGNSGPWTLDPGL
jgi:hypothetical protein